MLKNTKDFSEIVELVQPDARTTALTGTAIDIKNAQGCLIVLHVGDWTDGTHTPTLRESDDNSTFDDVASADLDGSFPVIDSADEEGIHKVAYLGSKRYLQLNIAAAGTTAGAVIGAIAIKNPNRRLNQGNL